MDSSNLNSLENSLLCRWGSRSQPPRISGVCHDRVPKVGSLLKSHVCHTVQYLCNHNPSSANSLGPAISKLRCFKPWGMLAPLQFTWRWNCGHYDVGCWQHKGGNRWFGKRPEMHAAKLHYVNRMLFHCKGPDLCLSCPKATAEPGSTSGRKASTCRSLSFKLSADSGKVSHRWPLLKPCLEPIKADVLVQCA